VAVLLHPVSNNKAAPIASGTWRHNPGRHPEGLFSADNFSPRKTRPARAVSDDVFMAKSFRAKLTSEGWQPRN